MNQMINFMIWIALWCNRACVSRTHASNDQSENGETRSLDVYLYSVNVSESQENKSIPCAIPDANELKLWKNHSYGVLLISQEADKNKTVPVWKEINKILKNVDRYLEAVTAQINELDDWYNINVFTGVSGILRLYNGSNQIPERPSMYSLDTTHNTIAVPIPKLIYRVIRGEWRHLNGSVQSYEAVVVIHNDPRSKYVGDRLDCERIFSWDIIENMFSDIALAYVCRRTEEISRILGIDFNSNGTGANALDLGSLPIHCSENPEREDGNPLHSVEIDFTAVVWEKYQDLWDQSNPTEKTSSVEIDFDNSYTYPFHSIERDYTCDIHQKYQSRCDEEKLYVE